MTTTLLTLLLGVTGGGVGPDTLPRHYEAYRTPSPIVVDGALTEPAWEAAAWTEEFVDIRDLGAVLGETESGTTYPPPPLRTRAKLLWDDECLYVAAEIEEPHLWGTLRERDAILYREDDFEIFLDPDGDGLAYAELEINALGTEFDLFLDRPYNRGGRADIGWDMVGLRTAVALRGTLNDPSDEDRGWSVEVAIPWSALMPSRPGDPPLPGEEWRVNFSRVDWPLQVVEGRYRKAPARAGGARHPESNWVWSPQGEINMHLPERWGVVRFVLDPQNSPSGPIR